MLEAAALTVRAAKPISDVRGSASYRAETVVTFQLFGERKEVIKSSASGTAVVVRK